MSKEDGVRDIAVNRRAFHDYFVEEKFEAGVVLVGTEVKSLRQGQVNLQDSWAKIDSSDEAWLMGAHISPFEKGNRNNHDPTRERKLLLHKREISYLYGKTKTKGLSLIPLRMYFSKGRIKLELALTKGKKLYDKRQDSIKKDAEREMSRAQGTRFKGRE